MEFQLGYFKSWKMMLSKFVQLSSVVQLCLALCDPMDRSTPGLSVHHQLPEFTQTHVHWVSDAIQPSHPLSSPSPPALNLSQHPGLFKWVSSSHQVTKLLELLSKYWTQYASKFGKLSHGHRTGKGQFSFQSQRKAMLKNIQTTVQLCSFHMLTM